MENEEKKGIGGGAAATIIIATLGFLIYSQSPEHEYGLITTRTLTIAVFGGMLLGLMLFGLRFVLSKAGVWSIVTITVLLAIIGDSNDGRYAEVTSLLAIIIGGALGFTLIGSMLLEVNNGTSMPNVFGSSRWATFRDLDEWGLTKPVEDNHNGIFLGHAVTGSATKFPIIYDGDMHALTVAPTRTGKGATAIIPNLLRSNSSILVIDPKGENARRTVEARSKDCEGRESKVFVIDPWKVSTQADKYGEGISQEYLSGFNPLSFLDPNDPDLVTDVMMLADALVIPSGKDPFWTEEAKALIYGIILYVITDEAEEDNRTLGRVRDIITLPVASENAIDLIGTFDEVLMDMAGSSHPIVRSAAARIQQKEAKEFSGVLSSAQSNTHFLDSPVIRKSLEGNKENDFSFADLKTADERITAYLVLPLDRLPTFNRWLRLLVTSALIDLTRAPVDINKPPVRVILDEFAALEKMPLIEKAYGTMAGLGVQLWVFTQDLGQLMKLYGDKAWQTFVSNAGVFQYFGSRDYETAKYAEHLCGMTTMKKRSFSFGKNSSTTAGPQGSSSTSGTSDTINTDDVSRPLAYADDMMTLHRNKQVLFIENRYPIIAEKHWWFER